MKTVAKINPELEYENAKRLIEQASKKRLDSDNTSSLDSSVDNLITAARVLMEREDRRRGKKRPPKKNNLKGRMKGDSRKESNKLPSERYPDLEVKENLVTPEIIPKCPCCNETMKESGLFDTSEKLETKPQEYYITRSKRPKFNCGNCHGGMVNTPSPTSIVPTSNYGDSLIIDVSLSKYCDLIPMERYAQIAYRNGLEDLPPQSLIGLTHHLANFLTPVYQNIKEEILLSEINLADETPHKMLEGDDTFNWYLWGFFSLHGCYFEAHDTRSGDVAISFLKKSQAKYLVTDGYPGYKRAIKEIKKQLGREIIAVYCNAHAFRYFRDSGDTWKDEVRPVLKLYGEIYDLERQRKEGADKLSPDEQLALRQKMLPLFEQIKKYCEEQVEDAMAESAFKTSLGYFLNHYDGLTVCTKKIDVPLDNNLSEREMRSPVVGRKTWIGTHSKRGAKTGAILFSLVQSCKMNNVNPRNFFPWIVGRIHCGEEVLTPFEYSQLNF
ncbi:MAG: IS66 family transposase [Crocinitomicaceae bacterium]|nr:IS66 family transposase [Crocinitomicaceae bacterium]